MLGAGIAMVVAGTIRSQENAKTCDKLVSGIKSYKLRGLEPVKKISTRGVVMVAGGPKYGPCGLNAVKRLKDLSPNIHIHVFGLNETELEHESMHEMSKMPNVTVSHLGERQIKRTIGWRCKIDAVIKAPFDEVLLLDADNEPLQDIEPLFELDVFKNTGALMWPDIVKIGQPRYYSLKGFTQAGNVEDQFTPSSRLIKDLDIDLHEQHESGQMMFDKKRCAKGLELAKYMNLRSHLSYKLMHGDKDTYQIAFKYTNTPMTVVKFRPAIGGHKDPDFTSLSLIQRHPITGKPLFSHRTGGHKGVLKKLTHVMYPTSVDAKFVNVVPSFGIRYDPHVVREL